MATPWRGRFIVNGRSTISSAQVAAMIRNILNAAP
jgi:hypothetical protein